MVTSTAIAMFAALAAMGGGEERRPNPVDWRDSVAAGVPEAGSPF